MTRQKRFRLRNFLWLTLGLIVGLGFLRFSESQTLKKQADALVAAGKPNEAMVVYNQALSAFPLRSDIKADIEGTKLIIASDTDYGRIYQIEEQIQPEPALGQTPKVNLLPNEIFVPILMYHHIEVNPRPQDPVWAALYVSPGQLDAQLSYFTSHNFHPISLDELYSALSGHGILPPKALVLTFDDGYRTFYDAAFPLLKKYHVKATQFVITRVVDSAPYLTWNQISEMDKSGLVELGAHTEHHPNLPDLPQSVTVEEIVGSQKDLESHLRKPVHWFAYPYGSYNNFTIQTVKDAGFWGAASTVYGAGQSAGRLFLLPRIMIDGRFTLDNIARRIQQ